VKPFVTALLKNQKLTKFRENVNYCSENEFSIHALHGLLYGKYKKPCGVRKILQNPSIEKRRKSL